MGFGLQRKLTIDNFDFIFISLDEHIFIPEQRMQFFLVVLGCRLLVLQLVFVHLLVLPHFFALLVELIVQFTLQFT